MGTPKGADQWKDDELCLTAPEMPFSLGQAPNQLPEGISQCLGLSCQTHVWMFPSPQASVHLVLPSGGFSTDLHSENQLLCGYLLVLFCGPYSYLYS